MGHLAHTRRDTLSDKPPIAVVDLTKRIPVQGTEGGCRCGGRCHSQRGGGDLPELPTVLLVDDDAEFLAALAAALVRSSGCVVMTAGSMAEATQVLQACPVTLVVADHYMPGRTGTALLQHVRQKHPGVGRAMMSGRATKGVLAGGVNRAAITQYLPKSMSPELMVKAIRRELGLDIQAQTG